MAPTDEDLRVRSYLLAQANKLRIPELVTKVREDTSPLRAIGAAVPAIYAHDLDAGILLLEDGGDVVLTMHPPH